MVLQTFQPRIMGTIVKSLPCGTQDDINVISQLEWKLKKLKLTVHEQVVNIIRVSTISKQWKEAIRIYN